MSFSRRIEMSVKASICEGKKKIKQKREISMNIEVHSRHSTSNMML